MRVKQFHRKGFTLVEIMIVVAIIGLLAAIAIPNFVKARKTAQGNACVNNLRQIDAAVQQYALEHNSKDEDAISSEEVRKYMRNEEMPKCPTGNTPYNLAGTVGAIPSVTCPNDKEGEIPRHKLGQH